MILDIVVLIVFFQKLTLIFSTYKNTPSIYYMMYLYSTNKAILHMFNLG